MPEARDRRAYDGLPPTLVISLEEGARRDRFRVECGLLLTNGYEILDAVDTRRLGNPHIGCALSHRKAIELAIERGWDEVLVLEDDAVPALDRSAALSVLKKVPAEAELVYLGGFRNTDYRDEPTGVEGLRRVRRGLTTTHALIYRRPVYEAVLDYIPPSIDDVAERWGIGEPLDYPCAIDQEYARWQRDERRAIYAVETPWSFVGNYSHIEPTVGTEPETINRNLSPPPQRALVSRCHQFITPLIPGNARQELMQVVALTEPEVVRHIARGAALEEAMERGGTGRWWVRAQPSGGPRYDHFCRFLVWQDPADRLRRLFLELADADPEQHERRWRRLERRGGLRRPKLDRHFERLVHAELSQRAAMVIDQRLRPQVATFQGFPVDVLVPLERLSDFTAERFGFRLPERFDPPQRLDAEIEAGIERLVERYYRRDHDMLNEGVPLYGVPSRLPARPRSPLPNRLPDYLIVGAMKAGTTTLHNLVTQHPEIGRAARKEIHFFDQRFDMGEPWYRSCFPRHGKITGEATPVYLFHPLAAERIAATVPDVRLIAILRNPVERAVSQYWQQVRRGVERLDFAAALAAEDERIGKAYRRWQEGSMVERRAAQFSYRRRGLYAEQLQRFFDRFDRERILVLGFEELYADVESGLSEVFRFLGVDPAFRPRDERPRHVGSYAKDAVPTETLEELRSYYEPHNERLFEMIGRRFDW